MNPNAWNSRRRRAELGKWLWAAGIIAAGAIGGALGFFEAAGLYLVYLLTAPK